MSLLTSATATRRTTKHNMKVYKTSTAPASTHVYSPTGPKFLNSPKTIVAHKEATMPPASCDTPFMANVKYETAKFTACKERLMLADRTCPAAPNTGGCSGGKVGDYTSAKAAGEGFTQLTRNGLTAPRAGCTDFWGNKLDGKDCWFGRGALQLTWPGNMNSVAKAVQAGSGIDICDNPDAICDSGASAFSTGIAYWLLNEGPWKRAHTFDSSLQVVRPADGSSNGLRKKQYEAYLSAMGITGPPPAPTKPPVPASCPQCSGGCWCTGGQCGEPGCSNPKNCGADKPTWLTDGSAQTCASR